MQSPGVKIENEYNNVNDILRKNPMPGVCTPNRLGMTDVMMYNDPRMRGNEQRNYKGNRTTVSRGGDGSSTPSNSEDSDDIPDNNRKPTKRDNLQRSDDSDKKKKR